MTLDQYSTAHGKYTVEHLESTRAAKLPPLNVFRAVLGELLGLAEDHIDLLDCGCGTGFFARQYARLPGVSVTGIDLDALLLNAARELARQEGLPIHFELSDITALPFPDESFDAVTSDILLEIFPDKTLPIGEMTRVCKPGGRILCIEPNYQSTVYYDPRLSPEDNQLWCEYHRLGRAFGAGVELPDVMRRVGLEDIQLVPWLWGGLGSSGVVPTETFLREQNAGLERGLELGVLSQKEADAYRALFRRTAALRGEALVLSGIDLYLVCGRKSKASV